MKEKIYYLGGVEQFFEDVQKVAEGIIRLGC